MTELESIYFDALRISAALVVVFGHVVLLMPGILPISDYGHYAVISFFVLSGYVIAFVADTKEKTLRSYFISRAARVFSVAIPSIIITLVSDYIGLHAAGHAIYQPYAGTWPVVRVGAALSFTSELWFLSIQPLSDGPYWSLCYEVWYYAIFAAAVFLCGRRRVFVMSFICLLVGPKIISMFPIWLLGVGLYHYRQNVGPKLGALLVLAGTAGLAGFIQSQIPSEMDVLIKHIFGQHVYSIMEYSHDFPVDYLVAALFSATFIGVRGLAESVSLPNSLSRLIKLASGSTFSIYLFHMPILKMLISVMNEKYSSELAFFVALCTIAISFALSIFTERRKNDWRLLCEFILDGLVRSRARSAVGYE